MEGLREYRAARRAGEQLRFNPLHLIAATAAGALVGLAAGKAVGSWKNARSGASAVSSGFDAAAPHREVAISSPPLPGAKGRIPKNPVEVALARATDYRTASTHSPVSFDELAVKYKEAVEAAGIVPGQYLPNGCDARAHLLADELQKRGIRVSKLFAEGEDGFRFIVGTSGHWDRHVLPVAEAVAEDGQVKLFGLDPTFLKKKTLVPLELPETVGRFFDTECPMHLDEATFDPVKRVKFWLSDSAQYDWPYDGSRLQKDFDLGLRRARGEI